MRLGPAERTRLATGICPRCGVRESPEDHILCDECREYRRVYARKRAQERKRAGLCVTCGAPRGARARYCAKHEEYQRRYARNYRRKPALSEGVRVLVEARLNALLVSRGVIDAVTIADARALVIGTVREAGIRLSANAVSVTDGGDGTLKVDLLGK